MLGSNRYRYNKLDKGSTADFVGPHKKERHKVGVKRNPIRNGGDETKLGLNKSNETGLKSQPLLELITFTAVKRVFHLHFQRCLSSIYF